MRLAAIGAATVAAIALAAPTASAATTVTVPPPSTTSSSTADLSLEEVAAITKAGIVYIGIQWRGFVQFPTSNGGARWSPQITASFTCSGFVASATGYIVTAGHCADPVEGRQGLINGFLAAAVKNHSLTEAQAEGLQGKAVQEWKVEGDNNGSAITRTVQVVQAGTASGVQVPQPLTANVVDNRPLDRGDVTLLKVEAPAPMLEVADTVPDVGSDIAAMGFPGSVSTVVDSSLEPSYKTGRVSASQTFNGNLFTQVDAAFSPGMSGGPVVNIQGQVIGIVSYSPRGEHQSFNFRRRSGHGQRAAHPQWREIRPQPRRPGLPRRTGPLVRQAVPRGGGQVRYRPWHRTQPCPCPEIQGAGGRQLRQ